MIKKIYIYNVFIFYTRNFLLGILIILLFISFAKAHDFIPKPKSVKEKGFEISLNNEWIIVTDMSSKDAAFSASWLKKGLIDIQSLELDIINFTDIPKDKRIIIGTPFTNNTLKAIMDKRSMNLPPFLGKQGYVIDMFSDQQQEIIIAASAPEGIFYGVQTLLQALKRKPLKSISIVDYPDHLIRGVDMALSPSLKIDDSLPRFTQRHKQTIDRLAGLKINMLSQLTGDHFFKKTPAYINAYREMVEYCRERYIDYVPNIGNLRTHSWAPFDLVEGWWIQDEPFRFAGSDIAIAEKSPVNLLADKDFSIERDKGVALMGWKVNGSVLIDTVERYRGANSIIINEGSASIDLPAEPNSHYQLIAYRKGARPAIGLRALSGMGPSLYVQFDYFERGTPQWTKFGIVLKTDSRVSKIRIELSAKNGPWWINSVKLFRIDGALKNIIRTKTTDIEIFNQDKTKRYLLGIDYEIINGETNKQYDDDLRPFSIRRLPGGDIAPGQRVLVNYDAVLYWSRSRFNNQPPCISDDRIYTEYYFPAIDKVMENLRPKIIHFASDEIRGFNRDSRNRKRGLTNAQLFAEWLNKISAYVKSKDPNCSVMIWDDMVSPYHNGGQEGYQVRFGGKPGRMAEVIEQDMISKDTILDIWRYDNRFLQEMKDSVNFFSSKGYRFFGSPWRDPENIRAWAELLKEKQGALGGLCTNWAEQNVQQDEHFPIYADFFWNTRKNLIDGKKP